jgi:hypothetical protein
MFIPLPTIEPFFADAPVFGDRDGERDPLWILGVVKEAESMYFWAAALWL